MHQHPHNKALHPTAYSFVRSSLRFRRRVSLVVRRLEPCRDMWATILRILQHWQAPTFVVFGALFVHRWLHRPGWFAAACTVLFGVGFLLNLLVIASNGGYMPVAADEDEVPQPRRELYKPIDDETRLTAFCDWIALGPWLISPGDVLLVSAVVADIIGRWCGLG